MSNIRVSVQWENSTVFAGEEVACTLTFTNIASTYSHSRSPSPNSQARGSRQNRDRWKPEGPRQQAFESIRNGKEAGVGQHPPRAYGHRTTLSLNTSIGGTRGVSAPLPARPSAKPDATNYRHKRSVSIISITHEARATSAEEGIPGRNSSAQPPTRHHVRSASLQGIPQKPRVTSLPPVSSPTREIAPGSIGPQTTTTRFPPSRSYTTHERSTSRHRADTNQVQYLVNDAVQRNRSSTQATQQRRPSKSPSFKFPRSSSAIQSPRDATFQSPQIGSLSPSPPDDAVLGDHTRSLARVLSPVSIGGTPRSSVDLYTASNHSSETLASEYLGSSLGRQPMRNGHARQPSHLTPIMSESRPPETLMMGYAQLTGSFTLDGSLVSLAPFEKVKRKGVIGGQGSGGVVGVESPRKETGLFGALGLSIIGESIGGFLGSSEMSSIREMKGIANTNSVPIISTPQAILFVDLKLSPGESKSFSYSHTLPKGMPPSHKGRAMKIVYQLVIGTQRAHTATQQHIVKHVEVPFGVLPGVNESGEILGHDLMLPHILLKNLARSEPKVVDFRAANSRAKKVSPEIVKSSPSEFLSYVGSLLEKQRRDSSMGLLSPTEPTTPGSFNTGFNGHIPMKAAIDLAILRGNMATAAGRSSNKFQIQRGGYHVGVIMLARPAYRLGETVSAVVDFGSATVPCYTLNMSLETSEIVDPSIALRSSSSVFRATRRTHASSSEDTIFAEKVVFSAIIPTTVAPEFITSGIQHQWRLRFEFVVGCSTDENSEIPDLLEEVANDERGRTLAAAQMLLCESFEVTVPVRVYGAAITLDDDHDVHDYPI